MRMHQLLTANSDKALTIYQQKKNWKWDGLISDIVSLPRQHAHLLPLPWFLFLLKGRRL